LLQTDEAARNEKQPSGVRRILILTVELNGSSCESNRNGSLVSRVSIFFTSLLQHIRRRFLALPRIILLDAMETAKEIQSSTASTKAPESEPSTFEKDDDGEYDLEDDEEEYPHLFESIRSPTGLEVGLSVTWPGTERIELSTCLPSDEIAPMFHGTQWYVSLPFILKFLERSKGI